MLTPRISRGGCRLRPAGTHQPVPKRACTTHGTKGKQMNGWNASSGDLHAGKQNCPDSVEEKIKRKKIISNEEKQESNDRISASTGHRRREALSATPNDACSEEAEADRRVGCGRGNESGKERGCEPVGGRGPSISLSSASGRQEKKKSGRWKRCTVGVRDRRGLCVPLILR